MHWLHSSITRAHSIISWAKSFSARHYIAIIRLNITLKDTIKDLFSL